MNKVSKYFSYSEVIKSVKASVLAIDNAPSGIILEKIQYFAINTVDVLRDIFGAFSPSSWYRCPTLNVAVGGSKNSSHMTGEAIDFNIDGMTVKQVMLKILEHGITFDQLIDEYGNWTHISKKRDGINRNEILKYRKVNGETIVTKLHYVNGELI